MLKPVVSILAFCFIPIWKNSCFVIPSLSQYPSKYFSTRLSSKISFPAGTGVCVVNTVFADTISLAIWKEICFSFIKLYINSNIKKEECPSFIWYIVGL